MGKMKDLFDDGVNAVLAALFIAGLCIAAKILHPLIGRP